MRKTKKSKNAKKRTSLSDFARKNRQIHLLQKLQEGKTLSPREIKELAALERGLVDTPLGCVSSQEELASVFGVTLRTVRRWVEGGMPVRDGIFYAILDVERWRAAHRKKGPDNSEKDEWETKIKKQKAQLQEIELKKALGEYVPLADVEKGRVERVIMVKRALFQLPKLCAQRCLGMKPQEIEAIVREYVEDICNKFAGAK